MTAHGVTFTKGQRVRTPKGHGTVLYVHPNPYNPSAASSVGVALDCMTDKSGQVFLAVLVTPLEGGTNGK